MQELDLMGLCLITLQYQKYLVGGFILTSDLCIMYRTIQKWFEYHIRTENNRCKLNNRGIIHYYY